jgi:SAM-dependent methyltransferase/uncharacterized protein YbaR (Trm112 family)
MKLWLLDYLVCCSCQSRLILDSPVYEGNDVEAGELRCAHCGINYPIIRGVPRMSPVSTEGASQRTVDAFGWQWQEFEDFHPDRSLYDSQFLDWVAPLAPPFFSGKIILDAGCGMGRFSAAAAHLGARRVVGVDLSDSVYSAHRFTRGLDNVAIVQADLYRLPFKSPFDFAFSIGVVHHLPNPAAGIKAIARHLKPDGTLSVWVYGYENNGWIRNVVDPVRKHVTSRLPRRVLYAGSLAATAFLQPVLRLLYSAPQASRWSRLLPYYPYLHWLAQFSFRHNHVVVFDHLVAPTAVYVRREEFKAWLEAADLVDIRLSSRNENSWRGYARRGTPLEKPG